MLWQDRGMAACKAALGLFCVRLELARHMERGRASDMSGGIM